MDTICVIHEQEDYITTWLVEADPETDPLEAIYEELFKGDEDWDDYLKDEIEWFYIDPAAAETLKAVKWPDIDWDVDHTIQHDARAAIYRAFKKEE